MDINSILACLCAGHDSDRPSSYHPHGLVDEKPAFTTLPCYSDKPTRTPEQEAADEQAAAEIMAILRKTDKTDAALQAELDAVTPVSAAGWSEWLAEGIFQALRSTLGDKAQGQQTNWAVALTTAYQTAKATAEDHLRDFLRYAKEHPGELAADVVLEILLSLITFGILVRMTKWVVRLLGFAPTGPVAGMCVSLWCLLWCCRLFVARANLAYLQLTCFFSFAH